MATQNLFNYETSNYCLTITGDHILCPGAPKHTNTIIVKGVQFRQAASVLLDEGYTIQKIDSNYFTVKTDFRKVPKTSLSMFISLRIKDSICTIMGSLKFSAEKDESAVDIFNASGGAKECFHQMDQFAKSLKGSEVSYKIDSSRRYKVFQSM